MLFHEIYGAYYKAVAHILTLAVEEKLCAEDLYAAAHTYAFEESALVIPDALTGGKWPFLKEDLSTALTHIPQKPLTLLQKRWLRTLLEDPRIALFEIPEEDVKELADVEPLFDRDALVYYDRYEDGDPYEDTDYIQRFRTVRRALTEHRYLEVLFRGRNGQIHKRIVAPHHLEYSAKDDKFRLICGTVSSALTLNLARITTCMLSNRQFSMEENALPAPHTASLVLDVQDDRNALERVLLHFSHLQKQTVQLDDTHYRISLAYDVEDETEMIIRVLSFGPMVQLVSPDAFRQKLVRRIKKQLQIGKK